jgi:pyruvate/2-oxoglutarate/acetoin dehydrogenase E1 component
MNYAESIAANTLLLMDNDPSVVILGHGVTDPKHIFGTTGPAHEKYPDRVIETPLSENMLTGALAGLAAEGFKPIYVHARAEFGLLGMEHLVNTIAKWPYLHNGQELPIIIRMLIGRGWGQGPTHSQSFASMFLDVPGLSVMVPVQPSWSWIEKAYDAGTPHIIFEPRRVYEHNVMADPTGHTADVEIMTIGDCVLEALEARKHLSPMGIWAEVTPIEDFDNLPASQALAVIVDTGFGAADYVAREMPVAYRIVEPPFRPLGSSPTHEHLWYPRTYDIIKAVRELLGKDIPYQEEEPISTTVRKESF